MLLLLSTSSNKPCISNNCISSRTNSRKRKRIVEIKSYSFCLLPELFIPGDHLSLSAIRTVRILRPLDVIHRVSSMRILVMLLLDTLPMLGNVLLLCFFLSLFIFVVIGVQLWKGLLRNHFFLHLSATSIDNYAIFDDFPFRPFYIPPDQDSFMCSYPSSNRMTKCSDIPSFRQDNMACELDFHTLSSSLTNKAINGSEQNRFSRSTTTVTSDQQDSCWEGIIKYFDRLSKCAYKRFRITGED
ncbi:unnamed protein product [Rotaria sp. Silwood2]|nr:unnamed protein product [Rotaria sp. Silwood2]